MMKTKRKRYLFFIRSDFQYFVCRGIISQEKLNKEDCYFIVERGVCLLKGDQLFPYYSGQSFPSFKQRVVSLFRNRKGYHEFFKSCRVTLYAPFSDLFPKHIFSDVFFFEEGFSSFAKIQDKPCEKGRRLSEDLRYWALRLLLPFENNGVRSLLLGIGASNEKPCYPMNLYITDGLAYQGVDYSLVKKVQVKIKIETRKLYSIPEGGFLFVLDRFSSFGRPYALSNYHNCVQQVFSSVVPESERQIWVKFHPADYGYADALVIMKQMFRFYKGKVNIFDGKLEYLAAQNIGIHFIGTNSTILYYAPILGDSNESISYSKQLADIDEDYNQFLQQWGGAGSFVEIFSRHVKCL